MVGTLIIEYNGAILQNLHLPGTLRQNSSGKCAKGNENTLNCPEPLYGSWVKTWANIEIFLRDFFLFNVNSE